MVTVSGVRARSQESGSALGLGLGLVGQGTEWWGDPMFIASHFDNVEALDMKGWD